MAVKIERLTRGGRGDPGCIDTGACELIAAEGIVADNPILKGVKFEDLDYRVVNDTGNTYEVPCPDPRCKVFIRVTRS